MLFLMDVVVGPFGGVKQLKRRKKKRIRGLLKRGLCPLIDCRVKFALVPLCIAQDVVQWCGVLDIYWVLVRS
jgi:hypothetical protein